MTNIWDKVILFWREIWNQIVVIYSCKSVEFLLYVICFKIIIGFLVEVQFVAKIFLDLNQIKKKL